MEAIIDNCGSIFLVLGILYAIKLLFKFICNISDCDLLNYQNSPGLTQKCSRRFLYFQMTTHKAKEVAFHGAFMEDAANF